MTLMEYSFCPKCGGPLISKKLKPIEPDRLVCSQCEFIFFLDPKIAACTLFTLDGKIVLLQRGIEPSYGKWVFPGGYVDRGETVEEAAIREAKEEVNLDLRLVSLLNVYSYAQSPIVIIVYTAEIVSGELKAADEALRVRTFALEEIPWDELAFPSTVQALQDYIRLHFQNGITVKAGKSPQLL